MQRIRSGDRRSAGDKHRARGAFYPTQVPDTVAGWVPVVYTIYTLYYSYTYIMCVCVYITYSHTGTHRRYTRWLGVPDRIIWKICKLHLLAWLWIKCTHRRGGGRSFLKSSCSGVARWTESGRRGRTRTGHREQYKIGQGCRFCNAINRRLWRWR